MSKETVKFKISRNEPRVTFLKPKFTQYTYTDKKDGRKRVVVRCEIVSYVRTPEGQLAVEPENTPGAKTFLGYPIPQVHIKTVGKAICDERDDFDYDLGRKVARIRAEKKAFKRHAKLAKRSVEKVIKFYQVSLENFVKKSDKVVGDPILWEK